MYARHFGLQREPFSIAPDPRCLFMSERHREALAHLLYGLQAGGGFVLLTGEIGTGKTTVCRAFLEQVPASCHVAYIFNPRLTVGELLQTVCDEFGVSVGAPGLKAQVDALNQFLLATHAAGGSSVLVIDEAQNLSSDVLEQLRLLTNLETHERKLLQIILIGQPELRDKLARPELEQLAQRVVARFHLGALDARDVVPYMHHRLAVAGLQGAMPFDAGALRRIQRLSAGVPRRINLLAGRALLGAYASGLARVNSAVIQQAARESFGSRPNHFRIWVLTTVLSVVAIWLAVMAVWLARPGAAGPMAAASAPAPALAPMASAPVAAVAAVPAVAASAASAVVSVTPASFVAAPVSEHDAQRALATLWGVSLGAGEPCEQARLQALQCFRSNSMTLATLRQLARPGVITLGADKAGITAALLVGLGQYSAIVRVGGQNQTLSLATLGRAWRGDFMSYWRADSANASESWLAQQLQQVDAADAADGSLPLTKRIQIFQRSQGLGADGVAGALTLMQLNRALGIDEPRLSEGLTP